MVNNSLIFEQPDFVNQLDVLLRMGVSTLYVNVTSSGQSMEKYDNPKQNTASRGKQAIS